MQLTVNREQLGSQNKPRGSQQLVLAMTDCICLCEEFKDALIQMFTHVECIGGLVLGRSSSINGCKTDQETKQTKGDKTNKEK